MSTKTQRLVRDGEKTGRGYGRGEEGRIYSYCYTVTTRMTPAERWAVMRAIIMFHNWDKVTRQCPQATTFEEKGDPKQIRT